MAENGREYLIQEHEGQISFEIGREKKDLSDPTYFNLAETTTLSKKHAHIFWDIDKQGFYIRNYSKNKILVQEEEVAMGEVSRRLENMTPIMIAKIRFYFLLPLD